jgi:hypothetical protein
VDQAVLSFAEPRIHPGRKLTATTLSVLLADGDGFVTRPVEELALDFEGVPEDRHRGWRRGADSRTPWYPRGTPIRNTRQVSLVSVEECALVAERMDIEDIRPEWLGANLVLSGIPHFSRLPAGTVLFFPSGASLRIEQINAPCRFAGASVAEHCPKREGLELVFVEAAQGLRGVVASVEREGVVRAGDAVSVKVPEQWIWEG